MLLLGSRKKSRSSLLGRRTSRSPGHQIQRPGGRTTLPQPMRKPHPSTPRKRKTCSPMGHARGGPTMAHSPGSWGSAERNPARRRSSSSMFPLHRAQPQTPHGAMGSQTHTQMKRCHADSSSQGPAKRMPSHNTQRIRYLGGLPLEIMEFLGALLQGALESSYGRPGKVYLALFAGTDPVGKVFLARGESVIRFDTKLDARLNLEHREVQATILKWMRSGVIWAVWLGTHCRTWSRASFSLGLGWYNSYRTRSHPWGELAKLGPGSKELVLAGNEHLRFSLSVLEQAAGHGNIRAGMENPKGSVMWLMPEVQALPERTPQAFLANCDYCQYGTRWKKPTTILWVGVKPTMAPTKCCIMNGGRCSRTGQPHIKLGQGRLDPKTGKPMTQVAEPYPTRLAKAFANCLAGEAT